MSVYLSIISGAIKLFSAIAQRLQQHHDEVNGANQVIAQNLKAENDAQKSLLETSVRESDADISERLRNAGF